eukprot:scaffold439418_cov18-Prasinocladus_malaysianus.AAC.1
MCTSRDRAHCSEAGQASVAVDFDRPEFVKSRLLTASKLCLATIVILENLAIASRKSMPTRPTLAPILARSTA